MYKNRVSRKFLKEKPAKMAQKAKINVKERFSEGEIDLSMSDLDEVPVKEIVSFVQPLF